MRHTCKRKRRAFFRNRGRVPTMALKDRTAKFCLDWFWGGI